MPANIFKKHSLNISIQQTVGLVHLCGMVTENIYGFIIPKTFGHDPVYMILFLSIPLSWLACKNECLISYLVKKHENPQYLMGSIPEDSNDLICLFPSPQSYAFFYNVNHGLRMVSVILVNYRSTHLPQMILIPTLVLYTLYIYGINQKRPCINDMRFKALFLSLLLVALYSIVGVGHRNNI